jgi:tol-pal system protein YbgF
MASASLVHAQAPIIDASVSNQSVAQPAQPEPVNNGAAQGELLYQLQVLQQEVMQLRGIVEEQAYAVKKLQDQSMERYIDVDRRLSELNSNPSLPSTPQGSTAVNASNTSVGSTQTTATAALAGEKDAYNAAYALVVEKRFEEALDSFKQFLIDYPNGRYAANSYYWMGELYQVMTPQDLESARQSFAQLLDFYPDHAKAADAMYKLGKVYFLKGNKKESQEWLRKVIADYGQGANSSAADKARQFINANF